MNKDQFIEEVFKIAFGTKRFREKHYDNRNFTYSEVIKQLEDHKEDSVKWHCIPDDDREEFEDAFYEECE
tara:strand:- start:231 stop:440 length:210 start_codon:yes stop_codon:yes gene_type:complete